MDGLLKEVISKYTQEGIGDYFIPPTTEDGASIVSEIQNWIENGSAGPAIVFGGYGIGKTTLALHLCYRLAKDAQADATKRVPVLVSLGEIYDEQSVEGLISRTLASRNQTADYQFTLFSELNRAGRFVIVFDGFDEMKHGMTTVAFQRNFAQLLTLDAGDARVILLGRPTIFDTEEEFEKIVRGQNRTALGNDALPQLRRRMWEVRMKEFDADEAREFVTKYFPHCVSALRTYGVLDQERLEQILSPRFQTLLSRPIHAKMLCELATNPEIDLGTLDKLGLYDRFVDHLIERETLKRGRSDIFSSSQRRAVNVAVAWWLLERPDGQSVVQEDVPTSLLKKSIGQVGNALDDLSLRRELLVGSLIEKAEGGRVYFPHYSILEFLASEYLINLAKQPGGMLEASKTVDLINVEISAFLIDRINRSPNRGKLAISWMDLFKDRTLQVGGAQLLRGLTELADDELDPRDFKWQFWGRVLILCDGIGAPLDLSRWHDLISFCLSIEPRTEHAAAVRLSGMLWGFARLTSKTETATSELIAAIVPLETLFDKLKRRPKSDATVEVFSLAETLAIRCLQIRVENRSSAHIQIDFALYARELRPMVVAPFVGMFDVISGCATDPCRVQALADCLVGASQKKRDDFIAVLSDLGNWNRLKELQERIESSLSGSEELHE